MTSTLAGPRQPSIPEADIPSNRSDGRLSLASAGRSAAIVGAAFVLSRMLGLIREVILGYRFGTTSEYDAYISAFRIPDLLFLVVMSGAFGAAFIPVLSGFLSENDEERAWRLASAVLMFSAIAMVVLSVVMALFAGPIIRTIVAPDLPAESQPVAIETMRILLLSQFMLGLGIASKGILEAQNLFTMPALAPVAYNAAIIVAAIALAPSLGVHGVAWGVVGGAFLFLGIQLPSLLRSGFHFTPILSRHVEGLSQVGRLLLPRVIGLAAFQLNFVVVTHLASGAGEGRVSAMNYAWQMMMLPHGVVALSISTVIFPAMARFFQFGDVQAVRRTFTSALMPMLFLTIPASIGLYELRLAIPQTLFQLGAFDASSTALVAPALGFLALGLVWYSLVEILARIFYAMQDTVTPVGAGIAIIVINIVLGVLLVGPLGHVGLAIALSVSTGVEALILFFILRRRIGGLEKDFGSWIGRVMLAVATMACMAELIRPKLDAATEPGMGNRLLQMMLLAYAVLLLACTYAVAGYLMHLPEIVKGLGFARRGISRLRPHGRS